jgi:hypothetical protein
MATKKYKNNLFFTSWPPLSVVVGSSQKNGKKSGSGINIPDLQHCCLSKQETAQFELVTVQINALQDHPVCRAQDRAKGNVQLNFKTRALLLRIP